MKNQIKTLLLIIIVITGINDILAQGNFQADGATSIGVNPTLYGDNNSALYWDSNHNTTSQLILRDKQSSHFGRLTGVETSNGKYFGIKDAANHWSYLTLQGKWTIFNVNDKKIMSLDANGVNISPINDTESGGKLTLSGAGSYNDWNVDNYGGVFRIFQGNNIMLRINQNGNIGIGTALPDDNKLEVNGTIRAKEIKVQSDWADYVFDEAYELPSLTAEQENIKNKGHLIGFDSEAEMNDEILIGNVTKKQQVKIEEIVLHLIEMNSKIEQLEKDKILLTGKLELLKQ